MLHPAIERIIQSDDNWVYHKMKLAEAQTNTINAMSNALRPEASFFLPNSGHLSAVIDARVFYMCGVCMTSVR
jgi:hypothetical protein